MRSTRAGRFSNFAVCREITMLTRFEEGTKLAQLCQAKLAEAELKIQQVEKNAAGELVLKPAALGGSPAAE
ncbi:MAG: exodeoxyribonuclease VII small subunit [Verrucomicrobia bacterium]|nr:exodeoxyribonuclease VII small subunit [Verrucomicrobiota bacterium]